MKLYNIAVNNLIRRKVKMLFLVLGLVIGVGTIVTLYTITTEMEHQVGDTFDQIGANILILPKSDNLSLSYGGVPVTGISFDVKELDDSTIDRIHTIKNNENIAIVSPKLLGGVGVENDKNLVLGVEFEKELRMKKWWKIRTKESLDQPLDKAYNLQVKENEVLLGAQTATKFNKKPGDSIKIEEKEYTVKGVLEDMGVEEDQAIIMTLPVVQQILNKPGVFNLVEVAALCNTCPIEDIVIQLSAKLPEARVAAVKEAVEAREKIVGQFSSFAMATSIVVLLIGSLIVVLTMMSSVSERTREIGIFRAIGFRKSHVARIILIEAAIISVIGGVLGFVLGTVAADLAAPMIAQMDLNITWDPTLGLQAVGLAIVIGLISSIIPVIQAAKLDPNDALRYI